MSRVLPSIGWLLLGLIAIAAMMISIGKADTSVSPAAESYAPSGAAALFALLQAKGYRVDIDNDVHPNPAPGEVAIAFGVNQSNQDPTEAEEISGATKSLNDAVKNGAIVVRLPLDVDFAGATSLAQQPEKFLRPDGQARFVSGQDNNVEAQAAVPLLSNDNDGVFLSAGKSGTGYEIDYSNAIGLTNRFIDKGQNAQVLLETLGAFAPPKAKLLFTEATFGNGRDPGLLRTIGAWAAGAWYQILFLFVVIIYSLNQRFGLPEEYRRKQTGSRELLDAITDIYTRAKATQAALASAADRAEGELRSVLKLPRDAGEGELYRTLPEDLRKALSEVRAASQIKRTRPKDALELVKNLESTTDGFLQDKKARLQPRKRAA